MKFRKLEALRGFAALYVVIHHLEIGADSWVKYITMQGQVAVMLFFVLSGFVIAYSSRNKTNYPFRTYFIKRFRRIYPVLIVAMIVAYLAACLNAQDWLPLNGKSIIGNLLNVQDLNRHPGFWTAAYYGNTPLWSLSYEWWFYMLFFPIFKFVKLDWQKWVALGTSIFGFVSFYFYPNQLSKILEYFIIWWWGVELARIWVSEKSFPIRKFNFIILSYFLMLGLLLLQAKLFEGKLSLSFHPVIEIRHFSYSFILIFLGLLWRKMKYIGYAFTFKPFQFFAPISYGIYVFHFPIIMKYDFKFSESIYGQYAVGFVLTCLLAYLIEVKLQDRINSYTSKWIRK